MYKQYFIQTICNCGHEYGIVTYKDKCPKCQAKADRWIYRAIVAVMIILAIYYIISVKLS